MCCPTQRTRTLALGPVLRDLHRRWWWCWWRRSARAWWSRRRRLSKKLPDLLAKWEAPSPPPDQREPVEGAGHTAIARRICARTTDLTNLLPAPAPSLRFLLASDVMFVVIIPVLAFFFLKDGDVIRSHTSGHWWMPGLGARMARQPDGGHTSPAGPLHASPGAAIDRASSSPTAFSSPRWEFPFGILLAVIAMFLEFIPMIGPLTAAVVVIVLVAAVSAFPSACGCDFSGALPACSGLRDFPAPDGTRRGDASAAGVVRCVRRGRGGRSGGHFPLRAGAGAGADSLPADAALAAGARPAQRH